MKKEVTLYKDTDFNEIYTEYDMEELYHGSRYETIYDNFYDFLLTKIDTGCFEEITATLSDKNTIYPFYYVEDGIGIKSIMEMYMAWQDMPYMDRMYNVPTFADFLNIPQEDRNAIMFYGFE